MARQNKKSETVFSLCVVSDSELLNGLGIILVSNISDATIRFGKKRDPLDPLSQHDEQHNKPAGWGLPGGGVKSEDFEGPAESVATELGEETGLKRMAGTQVSQVSEWRRIGVINEKTRAIERRSVFFKKGSRPSFGISEREMRGKETIENAVYIFKVNPAWENSELQSRMQKVRAQLLEWGPENDGATEDDVAEYGVWFFFDEISSEAVGALGIEGIDEIDGIGIFPISLFIEGMTAKYFPVKIYASHFKYVQDGLQKLGLIPKTEAVATQEAAV